MTNLTVILSAAKDLLLERGENNKQILRYAQDDSCIWQECLQHQGVRINVSRTWVPPTA